MVMFRGRLLTTFPTATSNLLVGSATYFLRAGNGLEELDEPNAIRGAREKELRGAGDLEGDFITYDVLDASDMAGEAVR